MSRKEIEVRNTLNLQTNESLYIDGKKSIFSSMVLRLMDTEEYSNDYFRAFNLVCKLFPELSIQDLEKELDKYI